MTQKIGPKSKVLPPGFPSNAHVTVEGAEEGEEVGGVDSVLRRNTQDISTFGKTDGLTGPGLENGWVLPLSISPGQLYDQGRLKHFEWHGRHMALIQSAVTLGPWGPERD